MAIYIHLGCKPNGRAESKKFFDSWIHVIALASKLEMMETVLDL